MANQKPPQDANAFPDMLARYRIRLEKTEGIDPVALAVLVAADEICKTIKTVGVPILIEANALRRMTMGEIDKVASELSGDPQQSKLYLPRRI